MSKTLSHSYVKKYIESNSKDILLSNEYKNNTSKLEIKCINGHIYYMSFANFKSGNRCKTCKYEEFSIKRKISYDDVKYYIEIESKSGYKLISKEYKNNRTHIDVQCQNGHIYGVKFSNFKTGYRCRKCSGCEKYTYEYVKSFIENNGYTLLSDKYMGSKQKLLIKCNLNHIYETTFIHFHLRNQRCATCFNINNRLTYSYVKDFVESELGYSLISKEYNGYSEKIEVQCNKKHIYSVCFHKFKNGRRCPYCKTSKNEKKIKDFLINNNIEYIQQYKIKDCKNKFVLRFDFGIIDENKKVKCLIEYDGEFHYNQFFQKQNLKNIQENDKIKNQYCKNNNIVLIRIPYWQRDRIEEILLNRFNNLKIIGGENIDIFTS